MARSRTVVPRVAVLTNAPAPYRVPFWNDLARRYRVHLFFETQREAGRLWQIDAATFLFNWSTTGAVSIGRGHARRTGHDRPPLHIPWKLPGLLRSFSPDVVVSDELGARTAAAALYCQAARKPLIVSWEGTPHTDGDGYLSAQRRRVLLRFATRVWANGHDSRQSLIHYGVQPEVIDTGMTGVDTHWWASATARHLQHREEIRARLGLRGAVVTYVGSLSKRKGIPQLLEALELVYARLGDSPTWTMLFVGEGPLAAHIDRWAQTHSNVDVVMAGFCQEAALPEYLAAGDLCVMPSLEDQWGLVCLEAIAAGLPVITTPYAGAAADLICDDTVGAVVDPQDRVGLSDELLRRIAAAPVRVPDAVRRQIIDSWSTSRMAERASRSIEAVLPSG